MIKKKLILILSFTTLFFAVVCQEITPYKFVGSFDEEIAQSSYVAPTSARFMVPREGIKDPDIIYYFSKPKNNEAFPIAVMCTGSTTRDGIGSIIHFHRYLLQEFMDLKSAVITLEQWGVDGKNIDDKEFMKHYTRSQRLKDHKTVIEHLKVNPPNGWNGKFIFLGASEGGPIVTSLTELYPDNTLATINWCGAGDISWQEQLWLFLQKLSKENTDFEKIMPSREEYDNSMSEIIANPTFDEYLFGMTYAYHADTIHYPATDYTKIQTPYLVVAGTQDSIIESADTFAQKAKDAGVNITYLRVPDMDHYVRKRPDIIEQSFAWLKQQTHLHL